MVDYSEELEVGKLYDFHLTDGTVCIGVQYRGIDINGNIRIGSSLERDYIDWIEDHDPDRPMTEIFK